MTKPNKETVSIKKILKVIANHFPLPVPLMLNSKAIKGHMTIAITTIGPNFPKEMFAWISIKKSSERAKKI